ncbi:MAG: hypothetical protein PWQ57_2305 [Desulfovibrionales bacterium]|jgi:hypothetical protein|nr:hypothetical protein [Desulfovibrionales bacterium]
MSSNALNQLDQALRIGETELIHLQSGEVEEAEKLAMNRSKLLGEAIADREGVSLTDMLDKLHQLKRLQGRITTEALKLQDSFRKDLQNAKRQNKRLVGYGKAMKKTSAVQAKYCSKMG